MCLDKNTPSLDTCQLLGWGGGKLRSGVTKNGIFNNLTKHEVIYSFSKYILIEKCCSQWSSLILYIYICIYIYVYIILIVVRTWSPLIGVESTGKHYICTPLLMDSALGSELYQNKILGTSWSSKK